MRREKFLRKRRRQQIIEIIVLSAIVVGLLTFNVYAGNRNLTASENNEMKQAVISDFDYSTYSQDSLTELKSILSYRAKNDSKNAAHYNYFILEIEGVKGSNDVPYVYPLYILRDRLKYGVQNSINHKSEYQLMLSGVASDISKHEERKKETLTQSTQAPTTATVETQQPTSVEEGTAAYYNEQIEWSKNFLRLETERFDYSGKDFSLKNVNIYDYFPDGEYCAPVKAPSLSRILRPYEKSHYGIDIKMQNGLDVFSVANNSKASVGKNTVILSNGTVSITYKNIKPSINNGETVNKGQKIGVFQQVDNNYKGLFFSMSKNKKEVSVEWFMTTIPFVPNKGMSMPLYLQYSTAFSNVAFGEDTVGASGCGPCALAMALSYVNDEIITPGEVCEKIGGEDTAYCDYGNGAYWDLMIDCPPMFGAVGRNIDGSEIIDCLKNGHPVIVIMGEGEFTKGGHFITLSGVDENDCVYVNDSNDNLRKDHYNNTYPIELITSQTLGGCWEIYKEDE